MTTFKQFLEQWTAPLSMRAIVQKANGAAVKQDISDTFGVGLNNIEINGAPGGSNGLTIYIDVLDNDEQFFKSLVQKALPVIIARYFKHPFQVKNVRVHDDRKRDGIPGPDHFVAVDVIAS